MTISKHRNSLFSATNQYEKKNFLQSYSLMELEFKVWMHN